MPQKTIHLVGFGSQASAWAQCLRKSGWLVQVYLARMGDSFKRALELEFQPKLIHELPAQILSEKQSALVAMLCPDSTIAPTYKEYLAHLDVELRLILAHGFAVYTEDLKFQNPKHQAALLAPKAIGPKLLQNFQTNFPQSHQLFAAFCPPQGEDDSLAEVARGLGFDRKALIPATFQQETVGDLISEQGLLCGGVFNLLEWTMEAMLEAGIPDALIREECLTELELIAGMIRERGPADAFKAISQAAQCGTIAMANRFKDADLKADFQAQMKSIQDQGFSKFFQSQDWRSQAKDLAQRLSNWQERFK